MKYKNILDECIMLLAEGANIWDVYEKYYSQEWDKDTFDKIAHLDPTCKGNQKGKYLPWLLSHYSLSQKQMIMSDMKFGFENITEVLEWYNKHKQLLPVDYRDINDFSTYQDLGRIYKRYVDYLFTQKEIRSQADIVYNDSEWEIVIPKTWAASKYYGANTEWCTTEKNTDMFFMEYTQDGGIHCKYPGPLYINIDKRNNVKYQFQFANGEFFDEHDDPIEGNVIKFTKMPDNVVEWYMDNVQNAELLETNTSGHNQALRNNNNLEDAVYFGCDEYNNRSYCLTYNNDYGCYIIYDVINDREADCDGDLEYTNAENIVPLKNGIIINNEVIIYSDNINDDLHEEFIDEILFTRFSLDTPRPNNYFAVCHDDTFTLYSACNGIISPELTFDAYNEGFTLLNSYECICYFKNYSNNYVILSPFDGIINDDFPFKPLGVEFDQNNNEFFITFKDNDGKLMGMHTETQDVFELKRASVTENVNKKSKDGIVVYRGMDKEHNSNKNIWITDSKEYALYWANKEYNNNGTVKKFFLPNSIIKDLCNTNAFEEIMNEYDAWQEIEDDSIVWENGEDVEYDLMHDLCFPSKEQILILKSEGYKGIVFKYSDDCYSILIFNGKILKEI